jgi:hypothetical protein
MTREELKGLGLTRAELSTMIHGVQKRMEAGTLKFVSDVMTKARKDGMLAIRSHRSNGLVDLDSIDLETASFIKITFKATAILPPSENTGGSDGGQN